MTTKLPTFTFLLLLLAPTVSPAIVGENHPWDRLQDRQHDHVPRATTRQLQIGSSLAGGRYVTFTNVKEILELSRDLAAMANATDTTEIEIIYRNGRFEGSGDNHTNR